MCRLLAYKGPDVILNDLLYKPKHSLIKQSYHAQEMEEPLNGDGFGVGWYNTEIDEKPALFTSVQPAWNNLNLQYVAPKISSGCVLAHVRAASVGFVNKLNCHPFHCGKFLMMHNGNIENFKHIRRQLLELLSDQFFNEIKGQTDSEHIFALFLQYLSEEDGKQLSQYRSALARTVNTVMELKENCSAHDEEPSYLNIVISDGDQFVGTRFVSEPEATPLSLHYAQGGRFECENNLYTLTDNGSDSKAVLIVSEKLNTHKQSWKTVPANHYFTVDNTNAIQFYEV